MDKIDLSSYRVTDDFFGEPYVDIDEQRDDPVPHRYVHGGFEDTTTRFAMWFPPRSSGKAGCTSRSRGRTQGTRMCLPARSVPISVDSS